MGRLWQGVAAGRQAQVAVGLLAARQALEKEWRIRVGKRDALVRRDEPLKEIIVRENFSQRGIGIGTEMLPNRFLKLSDGCSIQ